MLKTRYFTFDRFGVLVILADCISWANLVHIIRMCTLHARRKHTKKPQKYVLAGAEL